MELHSQGFCDFFFLVFFFFVFFEFQFGSPGLVRRFRAWEYRNKRSGDANPHLRGAFPWPIPRLGWVLAFISKSTWGVASWRVLAVNMYRLRLRMDI